MAGSMDRFIPWLTLLHAPGIGPRTCARLLEHFGSPQAVLDAGHGAWEACGLKAVTREALARPDAVAIERDLHWLQQPGNHLLTLDDPAYPVQLREISDPPPVLFVHGDAALLSDLQLAIVGSRSPTPAGRETATAFARHLAGTGLCITSGLALGIDAAAHQGALDGGGRTLAVMGTGLDRIYPARHRDLAHRIAGTGALVSEFPPGTGPQADHFPRRNRIISGLSLGVLVVEAAQRSGSLISARHAMEQGREVFAIPGSIHNPLARGCHRLIRQGAKLVETADDILEELGPLALGQTLGQGVAQEAQGGHSGEAAAPGLDGDYRRLLEVMGDAPVAIDQIVARSGLTAEAVSSMLLLLELQGEIGSMPGGLYCRTPSAQENL